MNVSDVYRAAAGDIRRNMCLLVPPVVNSVLQVLVVYFATRELVSSRNILAANIPGQGVRTAFVWNGHAYMIIAIAWVLLAVSLFVAFGMLLFMAAEAVKNRWAYLLDGLADLRARWASFLGLLLTMVILTIGAMIVPGILIVAVGGIASLIGYLIFFFVAFMLLFLAPSALAFDDLRVSQAISAGARAARSRLGLVIPYLVITGLFAMVVRGTVSALVSSGLVGGIIAGTLAAGFQTLMVVASMRIYAEASGHREKGALMATEGAADYGEHREAA